MTLLSGSSTKNWRRERDSNPRSRDNGIHAFQACAFDRSATSPWSVFNCKETFDYCLYSSLGQTLFNCLCKAVHKNSKLKGHIKTKKFGPHFKPKSFEAFSVVRAAASSKEIPLTDANFSATKRTNDDSFRLPLLGWGAR